jgi:hypothetical protein
MSRRSPVSARNLETCSAKTHAPPSTFVQRAVFGGDTRGSRIMGREVRAQVSRPAIQPTAPPTTRVSSITKTKKRRIGGSSCTMYRRSEVVRRSLASLERLGRRQNASFKSNNISHLCMIVKLQNLRRSASPVVPQEAPFCASSAGATLFGPRGVRWSIEGDVVSTSAHA